MINNYFILWLTGLPCSGKSTIANELHNIFQKRNLYSIILDGDYVRNNSIYKLGYNREDRILNIQFIGTMAKILSQNNIIPIVPVIAPYKNVRDKIRENVEGYIEVYVKCPVEVCIERDVKGMYKKALNGEIKNFTGIDDPYEEPENSDIVIETDKMTVRECVNKIMDRLKKDGYIENNIIWSDRLK